MTEENRQLNPCSTVSLEANEEMFGTAPKADFWFLLEYRGRWSGNAFQDSKIPGNVKARVNLCLESYPHSRLQLIKKQKQSDEGIKFYIALSSETRPRLYEFTLNGYEDLLKLDIDSVLKGGEHLREEPVFIVCTNGEYDTCCGRYGMPVYLDITGGVNGPDTWQSTHVGGHRFASTFVCLPHGVYYGRLREGGEADKIIDEYRSGTINIQYYRGRSCYDPDVQAAEYFVRKETGIGEMSAFILKEAKENNGGAVVEFTDGSLEKTYRASVRKYDNALKLLKGCGEDEMSSISQYGLDNFSIVQHGSRPQ